MDERIMSQIIILVRFIKNPPNCFKNNCRKDSLKKLILIVVNRSSVGLLRDGNVFLVTFSVKMWISISSKVDGFTKSSLKIDGFHQTNRTYANGNPGLKKNQVKGS